MDLRTISYFLAIAETGSINRAARRLYISQPALSQHLKRLENELGVSLVLRSTNSSLTLTEAGKCFLDYCTAARKLWKQAEQDMEKIRKQDENCLIIGASSAYLQTWLPNSETEAFLLSAQSFDIMIDTAENLEKRLTAREADIILGPLSLKNPLFTYEISQNREVDLSVSKTHPLARYSYLVPGNENLRITLSEASPYPFLLLEEGTILRSLCEAYFHSCNFRPRTIYENRRSVDIRIKLITGNAVGFMSPTIQTDDSVLPIALNPPIYYPTGAAYRKGETLPLLLRKLIDTHFADVRKFMKDRI